VDVLQKIFNDVGDGYIVDIQFVALNEEKQQVERPFKLGQFYLICRRIHYARLSKQKIKNPGCIKGRDFKGIPLGETGRFIQSQVFHIIFSVHP
jgi:hypothetical protein